MKQIELSTGTLLVVGDAEILIKADPTVWQLLGHPSEITGDVWGRVCESSISTEYGSHGPDRHLLYRDYDLPICILDSPLLSGLSLCAAHNIQESDVLLFKTKNS